MKTGSRPNGEHTASWFSLDARDIATLTAQGVDGTTVFDEALGDGREGCAAQDCKLSCIRYIGKTGMSADFGCSADCTGANEAVTDAFVSAARMLSSHGVQEPLR